MSLYAGIKKLKQLILVQCYQRYDPAEEMHEKDVCTIWLERKNKFETKMFKTISSVSDIWLYHCCISSTLSEKVTAKLFQTGTMEPKDKSAITTRLNNSSERG